MEEVAQTVGMCHSAAPVAELFVEQTDVEPKVMENKEEEAPFQERDIKSFESFHTECPGIVEIFSAEEISGGDEEERHVEYVDEIGYK